MRSHTYDIRLWLVNHLLLMHKDQLSEEDKLDLYKERDKLQDERDEYFLEQAQEHMFDEKEYEDEL